MLYTLNKNNYHTVTTLVENIKHNHVVIFSVLEGNTPGIVMVDDPENPKSVLIKPDDGFFYIISPQQDINFLTDLHTLFFNEWKVDILELFLFPQNLPLKSLIGNRKHVKFKRLDYRLNKEKFTQLNVPTNPSIEIENLMASIKKDNKIISQSDVCFQYKNEIELSCKTDENYQKQGLAFQCCHHLIKFALESHLIPSWSCWEFNEASNHLAQKLGFECVDVKEVIIWDTYIDKQ